ncbi:hypothetical protein [Frankia sp. EI5c]|uniref:hypothetical protein n=1 Tax=Frankia sp. EI5c TaxID=683316 RepID=UPI000FF87787|nr:hypothetical protein [Frankia sp. EI5c]
MALLLVPALVMSGVMWVVLDRVTDPKLVPISERNPFRDAKLPESSDGSAAGREHLVPAEATSRDAVPEAAELAARVAPVEGAVPVTPEVAPRRVGVCKVFGSVPHSVVTERGLCLVLTLKVRGWLAAGRHDVSCVTRIV